MIGYFDTSAFVKLLIGESGSVRSRDTWGRCERVQSSLLLAVEARAAVAAAHRARRVSEAGFEQARDEMARLLRDVQDVAVHSAVVERAGELAEALALRGYDAVHLASAEASECDVMVTADADLVRAAPEAGLDVIDVRG
jgi:predicted nucleic acid-binding protein